MIKIFTDGSSRGNPGPGGWGAIVQIESEKSKMKNGGAATRELGGRENSTTNNRMELKAAIEALRYVKTLNIGSDETVEINSDSEYVVKGMTQWIYGWKRKGWTGSAKKPVMNRDLWEDLDLA
ncbi:MAG: ribonuclease HI, partial [Patescibacteria group bacterium]|nr:ribonuclease HI [Patescibacteria group bacterium]